MKRIVLKISGEMLGNDDSIFFQKNIDLIIENIRYAHSHGLEIIIVVGGGNLIRGRAIQDQRIRKITSDYMGMISTIINSLALRDIIHSLGIGVKVFSSYNNVSCINYEVCAAEDALLEKNIVIIAGGTGRPHSTTDTAAVLAATELCADAVIKTTKVDGVYDSDPVVNHNAKFIPFITYTEALTQNLQIMDLQAFGLAQEKQTKIIICKLENDEKSLFNIINNQQKCSIVYNS